jgi:formamidopyrimidine-DNA glycosylase
MPELPEVDAGRRIVERVAAGRRIVAVRCADDPIVFERVSPARLRSALLGREIVGAHRHGKHLWIELDRRPWPVIHFGMTGGIHARGVKRVRLQSDGDGGPGTEWPPRFTKLHLTLDDGGELVFADARRLGRVRLRRDPRAEPPVSLLGFDALLDLPPLARFRDLLGERSAPIKAVLLDQTFSAGVGNWIADEVLYQARISPRRRANSLTPDEARRLRGALRMVIGTAIRAGANTDRFPKLWLFHVRWERSAGVVTPRGERIRRETIGGRTAAWVPSVQR